MAIALNCLWEFPSPIKLGSSSRCSALGKPLTLSINFGRSSGRYARRLTIPLATDSEKVATDQTSTSDSVTSDIATASNQPPSSEVNDAPKKSPLTAREKLRAARVVSRYNAESKPAKARLGSKVLDALRESDIGKRPGLPQAPTNLFDDSKRGMPKQGLTFDLPGGSDLFFIALSFVLITTVMFTTTYVVWKLGAIHFNEY